GRVAAHLEAEAAREGKSREPEMAAVGAAASRSEMRPRPAMTAGAEPGEVAGTAPSLATFASALEQAPRAGDLVALERTFGRGVGIHSLRDAFARAVAPALDRLAEHPAPTVPGETPAEILIRFARAKLAAALAGLRPLHQQPRVLCAPAPGEPRE